MTLTQQIITIALCALGTMATRFLPFLLFSSRKPTPGYIRYVGNALPAAIFGMLVVYCLRGISFSSPGGWMPQLLAAAAVAVLHLWKHNNLLSIFGGTVLYMVLVQAVF